MSRPVLPPRGIFVPTKLLEAKLKPPMMATAVKLLALTWGRPGGDTPELSWEFLQDYTGLHRSQLYGHMDYLASMGICAWMSRRGGYLTVRFSPGYFSAPREESEISDTLIGGGNLNIWVNEYPTTSNDSLKAPPTVRNIGQSSDISDEPLRYDPEIYRRLTRINVFPDLWEEVERFDWEESALLDLMAECEQASTTPGALFMYRIRNTERPPSEAEQRQRYAEE